MDFCKASDFYRGFQRTVIYSEPVQSRESTLEILQQWWEKERPYWPRTLSPENLASDMHCVHVPYLFAQAEVSFDWSAVVTISETGSRPVQVYRNGKQETEWRSYTYHRNVQRSGSVVGRDVRAWRVDAIHGGMKSGVPDFGNAGQKALHGGHSDLTMLSAPTRTAGEVTQSFQDLLETEIVRVAEAEAARGEGNVTSVKITEIAETGEWTPEEWVHLYPVWLGRYMYKDKVYAVEIDDHTGQAYVEKPFSVRAKKAAAMTCGCFFMIMILNFCLSLLGCPLIN